MKYSQKKEDLRYISTGLYSNLTDAYNAEMNSFIDILCGICKTVTEYDDAKHEYSLNKSLYFVLNMAPLLDMQRADYLSIIDKRVTKSQIETLKEQLAQDIAKVLSAIRRCPVMYDEPEEDIAKLHFNGAFGKGLPNPSDYNVECSPAVRGFNVDVYKRIRSAFTVQELIQIDSNSGKYAVLYILTGYYINEYYDVVTNALRKAGLQHIYAGFSTHRFIQDKLDWILMRLTNEHYDAYVDAEGYEPINMAAKKELLSKRFCSSKIQKDVIKLLDEIGKDFKIGTKACSKRRFCEIVYVIKEHMDCWNEEKYVPSRHLLSRYYGFQQEPTYKISECRKFEQSEDGKILIHKIQKFCAEH